MSNETSTEGNSSHFNDHNYALNEDSCNEVKQINYCFQNPSEANNWQISSKRRSQDSLTNDSQKKTKQDIYKFQNLKTSNRFEVLSRPSDNEDSMEADASTIQQGPTEPKPPPIFIPNVNNVHSMVQTFTSVVASDDFLYKCINQNSVKILPKSAEVYRKLVHKLNEGNVSFHTYQLKQERSYRVVLKNMHYSVDINELKEALSQHGHTVRNITNVLHSYSKKPLSMFFIDLEPSANNKDIFNIQYLLHAKIVFEPPYRKKEIVQCKRCQQYGHTKSYCKHPFKCVKCGQDHETVKCIKDNSTPAICALCGGDHPANYRGCSVFKTIQKKVYPPLREKSSKPTETVETCPDAKTPAHLVQPHLSYAEVVTNKVGTSITTNNSKNISQSEVALGNISTKCDLTNTITQFFDRFEKIFLQQSQQIGALLDLLTTVLKKMN